MSTTPKSPKFWPTLDGKATPEVQLAIKMLFNGQQQHDDAIVAVNTKVTAAQAAANAATTPTKTAGGGTGGSTPITTATFPQAFSAQLQSTLGTVDNETTTAKTIQSNNYGGIVTVANASPVTVTLNNSMAPQYFGAIQNLGTANATLLPASGLINLAASLVLAPNTGVFVYYDGVNWWAVTGAFSNPMTATGDMIVGGVSGAPGRLGIGGNGQVLTSNGTDPSWQTPPANVASLQGETGALTLTSSGGTVAITTPTGTSINLEATGGGGSGILKGTVTLTWGAGPTTAFANATIAGVTTSMSALLMAPPLSASGGSFVIEQGNLTAVVSAANTVDCLYDVPAGHPSGGPSVFPVIVFT